MTEHEKHDLKIRTNYWLELLRDSGTVSAEKLNPILKETDELTAIFVTIVKKVKNKRVNR
jgi:four helix bundle protein